MYTKLLLLSHFSRVRLCVTPQTAPHQAPPSLGFSRQEHWSGLPFPSPMMKVKSESAVTQSCPLFVTPWTAAYQAPPSMGFSRQEYCSGVPLPSPTLCLYFTTIDTLVWGLPTLFCPKASKGIMEKQKGTKLGTKR